MAEATLAGLSILIVEDEPLLRRQIAAELERLGADATGATSVATARRFLDELSFDFALLDVNLPDGKGTDLLKEKSFSPSTAVIVMTAHGGVGGAVESMRLGAVDYLVKPFDPAELPLVIARAHRTRQSARIEEHRRGDSDQSGEGFFFGASLTPLENNWKRFSSPTSACKRNFRPFSSRAKPAQAKQPSPAICVIADRARARRSSR